MYFLIKDKIFILHSHLSATSIYFMVFQENMKDFNFTNSTIIIITLYNDIEAEAF